jgi:mono/diheme cytochrome c family protein
MGKALLGVLIGIVLSVTAVLCYVRMGFVDPRADADVGTLEKKLAMPALDASVDRRAPDLKNPIQATDENLMSGMNVYQQTCAGCHGDIQHVHSAIGDSFYPRAPQFVEDAPDMPENQNYYITVHGIRLSGMPAWGKTLNDHQIWQVITFLSHMDKLPPQVSTAWKATAGTSEGSQAANADSKTKR